MVDNVTARILESLAASKQKGKGNKSPKDKGWKYDTASKAFNPMRVNVPLPSKKIPERNSLVSFYYLYMNGKKYQPDEFNSTDVRIMRVSPAKFKMGSKGLITFTKTLGIPEGERFTPPHVYKQVIRCTPADYNGKISQCPGIVVNCECVSGDNLVLTDKGWEKVYALAGPITNEYPINYNINGRFYKGSKPFLTGRKLVYKLSLSNGEILEATQDHLVRVYIKSRYKTVYGKKEAPKFFRKRFYTWKKIKDIKCGDKILLHHNIQRPVEKTKEFYEGVFLGLLMGDGTVFNTGYGTINAYTVAKYKFIKRICKKLDIINSIKMEDVETSHGINYRFFFNVHAREIMEKYNYVNKKSVNLSSREFIMGYWSGLISTDGGNGSKGGSISITGGRDYLYPLFLKLREFGILTRFRERESKGEVANYGTRTKNTCSLSTYLSEDLLSFLEIRPDQRKNFEDIRPHPRLPHGIVVSKKRGGRKYVYDITVPDKHKFVANGMIVHNCPRMTFTWNWVLWSKYAAILTATNEPPQITNPRRLVGTCISKGEIVSTKKGLIPIEKIKVGDKIWTKNGWDTVTESVYMGIKNVVKIKSIYGRSLICTPDHKIYVFGPKGFEWIEAKDLTSNYYLISSLPSKTKIRNKRFVNKTPLPQAHNAIMYTCNSIKMDQDLAEIFGYMISEGSDIGFANTDPRILRDFFKKWTKKFGKGAKKGNCSVTIYTDGYNILKELGYIKGSYNKVIPQWIMEGDDSLLIACIRGMYAGDGNFRGNWSTYATVSKKLAKQLHLILLRLGISSYLRLYKTGINKSNVWHIRTHDFDNTNRLYNILNPIRKTSNGKIPSYLSNQLHFGMGSSLPFKYVRRYIKTQIRKSIKQRVPNKIIKLKELPVYCKKYSLNMSYRSMRWAIVTELKKEGKVTFKRFRAGGKPHLIANLLDIEKLYREKNVQEILAECCLNRYSSNRFYKSVYRTKIVKNLEILESKFPKVYENVLDFMNMDITFERVESVVPLVKPRKVYDLGVEKHSQFTANGFVVHNCKHVLAVLKYIKKNGL